MVLKVDFVKVSLSQNCQGVNMSKTVTNLKFLCNMFFSRNKRRSVLLSFCLSYCYILSTLYDVLYKNFYPKQFFEKEVFLHSMARANLNKSVWLVTNATTASKYIPKRTRICIN